MHWLTSTTSGFLEESIITRWRRESVAFPETATLLQRARGPQRARHGTRYILFDIVRAHASAYGIPYVRICAINHIGVASGRAGRTFALQPYQDSFRRKRERTAEQMSSIRR